MSPLPEGTPFDARQLTGAWCAAMGSFAVVMDERWWFGANGTGSATLAGTLSGTTMFEFEWRPVEVGVVELRLLRMIEADDAEGDPDELDDGPGAWERLSLVSGLLPHDGGGASPCVWTPPRAGFWTGAFPLTRS